MVLSAKSRITFSKLSGNAWWRIAFLALVVVINPHLTPIETVLIVFVIVSST